MFMIGILLVWPFVFDAGFTFLRRLYSGENVFIPHRTFLFHRLVLSGRSHLFVTLLYMALSASGVILAFFWWLRPAGSHAAVALLLPMSCLALLGYVEQQEHGSESFRASFHGFSLWKEWVHGALYTSGVGRLRSFVRPGVILLVLLTLALFLSRQTG